MTALPAKADISGTPSRATANAGFGSWHDFENERFVAGTATAAEKAATRAALETARGMQPVTASVGSNALTLTLNPTNLEFRSATIASGAVLMRTVPAAASVVISSGSTLGTVSALASRIAMLAIDNAGTVELAAVNADGGFHFDESQLISTTAEGGAGAADSASVVYSTTARSNVAFRLVGYIECTQATAGTWATAPSKIQGSGGRVPAIVVSQTILLPLVATTSGTSVSINTAIPAWVKRILINSVGVSSNGTDAIVFRPGPSGGAETSGYNGRIANLINASAAQSTGIALCGASAAGSAWHGQIELLLADAATNTWTYRGSASDASLGVISFTAGSKSFAGPLTQILMTTPGAANTFDGGYVSLLLGG